MSKNLLVSLAVSLLFLSSAYNQEGRSVYGQDGPGRVCADVPGQTSGTRRFQRVGETLTISLRAKSSEEGKPTDAAECEPVELNLRWANGRNIGSLFSMTFLDTYNRPIYTKSFSGFLIGNLEIDLATIEPRPVYGSSMMVMSVPASVTIQAAQPFAPTVNLSYQVIRVAKAREKGEKGNGEKGDERSRVERESAAPGSGSKQEISEGNEVVSIRNVVRLIGASKVSVVQIELKTARPFPVKAVPLQLQIGKKVFVDELSGDFTGRKLTLSLTPEMFAELQNGDEIVASFGKHDGSDADQVWRFGRLEKKQ